MVFKEKCREASLFWQISGQRGWRRENKSWGGGTWATNDIENALIYGNQISVVPKPKKILQSEIDDAFARFVDQNFGKEYGFDEATPTEWEKLRDRLLQDEYDALEITAPVNGNVQDFWILEQPRLLGVEEAILEIGEEDGQVNLIDN